MKIGKIAKTATKKKKITKRNIKIIPSQLGILFAFILERNGEKRIERNVDKKRITRTDVRSERIYSPPINKISINTFLLNSFKASEWESEITGSFVSIRKKILNRLR